MSTTGGTRGGGSGTNSTSSMHLTTSKQEPLTSIVVIKTETGSLNSGNIMGVSDEVTKLNLYPYKYFHYYNFVHIRHHTCFCQIFRTIAIRTMIWT